jgi:hypothetical protein
MYFQMPVEFHLHTGVKSISDMISLENFPAFQIATTIVVAISNVFSPVKAPLKKPGRKCKM